MQMLTQNGAEWLLFRDPVEVLTAWTPAEAVSCLQKMEASGLWAGGFIAYEAASAFDSALKTHAPGSLPLLQFGLFQAPVPAEAPVPRGAYQLGRWTPSVSREEYAGAIAAIKQHIAAGDTYQVNYTLRLHAPFTGDPVSFFADLAAAQRGGYSAFLDDGRFAICSASPELFFELKDSLITSRPMKGTRPRGLTAAGDRAAAVALRGSTKDRAENIMIVDMIRNDIGRIAVTGSVETLSCFDVEKYPTVWQMTSTVRGKVAAASSRSNKRQDAAATLKALFPCASITGAPKAKTMDLIAGLETAPRGVYTGGIGFIAPDGTSRFSVAIRTAVVDRLNGSVEYGIGGGIVWDSDADEEYDEALSKAAILARKMPSFELLETMLWADDGIFLLERHLNRLADSAEYFDYPFDRERICAQLRALRFENPVRIRLLLGRDGRVEVQSFGMNRQDAVATLAIANDPVDSKDLFLYHKTTNRAVYERAKAAFPDADDVLLFNERGEITESCTANVVVELNGRKITPPVSCGLLAGTFRDELLARGEMEEGVVTLSDLRRASAVWLINSVRKWRRTEWFRCAAPAVPNERI